MSIKQKKLVNTIAYMLSPEDTTAPTARIAKTEVVLNEKWAGKMKALLWVTISLVICVVPSYL